MKLLIKLLIAAMVVHASWKTGTAFWRYYNFKDGAQAAALFAGVGSASEIHNRVFAIATKLDVPLEPAKLSVRREPNHILINASYTEKIEVVPSFFYPWDFKVDLDVFTLQGSGESESASPQK
jgi:hypothetical protein